MRRLQILCPCTLAASYGGGRPARLWAGRVLPTRRRQVHARTLCTSAGGGKGLEVVVVGGGAAGMTAAWFAAEAGANVTVLERTREAGKKILMSGGSRCNVLPAEVQIERDFFSSGTLNQVRSVFRTWSLDEAREWLQAPNQVGLSLSLEEETNKYFPTSNNSREVRDRLVAGAEKRGVSIRYDSSVEELRRLDDGRWRCRCADGSAIDADRLVVATGGLSFPAVGTDGTGHRLVSHAGHTLQMTYPALTPLTGQHPHGEQLAGVSLYDVQMKCVVEPPPPAPDGGGLEQGAAEGAGAGTPTKKKKKKKKTVEAQRSGFLFTHRGYSGPSVLDLSHHAILALEGGAPKPRVVVDWTGEGREVWEQRLTEVGKGMVSSRLNAHLPNRLADALAREAGVEDRRMSELRKTERMHLLQLITEYELQYTGHQGYKKAEVTGGGVPLSELNLKTMHSKVLPGVFLCGEIVDVFGRIGGFNFYWAWVSGRLAGLSAAARSKEDAAPMS